MFGAPHSAGQWRCSSLKSSLSILSKLRNVQERAIQVFFSDLKEDFNGRVCQMFWYCISRLMVKHNPNNFSPKEQWSEIDGRVFSVWCLWGLRVRQTGQVVCLSDFCGAWIALYSILLLCIHSSCFLKIFPVLFLLFLQMPVLNPVAVRAWSLEFGDRLMGSSASH